MKTRGTIGILAFTLFVSGCAIGGEPPVDRVHNIENAGVEIAEIHIRSGWDGEREAFQECYQRESPQAQTITPELETCMAEDIIATKAAAALFQMLAIKGGHLPPGAVDPDILLRQTTERVATIFKRFGKSPDDALAFEQIALHQGMQAYGHTMFPGKIPAPN